MFTNLYRLFAHLDCFIREPDCQVSGVLLLVRWWCVVAVLQHNVSTDMSRLSAFVIRPAEGFGRIN